mmetsp:Transcript_34174/g.76961  ORF Transcript_34174/g.76961 Transcript_34174/m.76961 type:complete len:89 (-) Transcript_34174:99-365(-)
MGIFSWWFPSDSCLLCLCECPGFEISAIVSDSPQRQGGPLNATLSKSSRLRAYAYVFLAARFEYEKDAAFGTTKGALALIPLSPRYYD